MEKIIFVLISAIVLTGCNNNDNCQEKLRECALSSNNETTCKEATYELSVCKNHPDAIAYKKKADEEEKLNEFCSKPENIGKYCLDGGNCSSTTCRLHVIRAKSRGIKIDLE